MKITILQLAAVVGDRAANFRNVEQQAAVAADNGADVLVLPELWDVGYALPRTLELGDESGAAARNFLQSQAVKYGVNIVGGSVVRREGDKIWNTTFVYDRRGNLIAEYDKLHLFSPAGEDKVFQPGEKLALYELDGVRAAGITCYDLRFGELVRTLALSGAQLLFVPAAWPYSRLAHWRLLVQTRAVENQFFVAAANAVGQVGNTRFGGHSMLVDPWGEIVAEADEDQQALSGICNFSLIEDVRGRISVFRDRRPSLYKVN